MKLVKMQLYINAVDANEDNQQRGASEAVVISMICVCRCCAQGLHPTVQGVVRTQEGCA